MKTAKLFSNGQSQAVRLPKEFRFKGKEVFIKRVGNAIVLLPKDYSWDSWLENLNNFSEDFMETRDQLVFEVREDIFDETDQ
jgi:antitoxin VapB